MGEIRYGPAGLPEAPTFEEAFAALAAEGYRACEIGFVSGFWLDYETAPLFGGGSGRRRRRALGARAARGLHGPCRPRQEVQDGARDARPHRGPREGLRRAADRLPSGLPARPRARAGDRRRRRPARRPARAARGEGPARPVRRRGDGPRPRPRHGRRRARDRGAVDFVRPGARLRPHARDERRRLPRGRRASPTPSPARTRCSSPARRSTSTSATSSTRTATRRSTCRTARGRCAPSRCARRSRASSGRRR